MKEMTQYPQQIYCDFMQKERLSQGERIRTLLKSAKEEAVIIAPFIKVGALESLLQVIPSCTRIRCVTRWLPRDIATGVSDPEIINPLEKRGNYYLSLVDNLHAKLYIADCRCLAGSANVTVPALGGFGEKDNIEILIDTTVDNLSVKDTLDAISRTERQATRQDAETARRLATNYIPMVLVEPEIEPMWFPRSRMSERAFKIYRNPPIGYLSAADKILLEDIARANIQPGLEENQFRLKIRCLLAKMPLAKLLLDENKDVTFTKFNALPYISSIIGDEFSVEDLWLAFVNWMSYYFSDKFMKQEITEIALRRAEMLSQ